MTTMLLLSALISTATVESRVLEKDGRIYLTGGPVLLDRRDLLLSPGARLAATQFFGERWGIDYAQLSWFATEETAQAEEIRRLTGFVPDRGRPRLLVGSGGRYALAYGKLLLEALGTVLHLSGETFVHGGALVTDLGVEPAMELGLTVRVQLWRRVILTFDYALVVSLDTRRNEVVAGSLPTLLVGAAL